MPNPLSDHYATLGLHRRCSAEQIRNAYRILAKEHHPDLHGGSYESQERTRVLNAAYEVLGDPDARKAYDRELAEQERRPRRNPTPGGSGAAEGGPDSDDAEAAPRRGGRTLRNLSQDVALRPEEFLRGARLEVRVEDPGNPAGAETYPLEIPAETAPGTRFRIRREGTFAGGVLTVRATVRPDPRFKAKGADLRCDLRIPAALAQRGGPAMVRGLTGTVRVQVPAGIARGEEVVVDGEGLPNPRGGRGALRVRVMYQPEIRIRRERNG